MTNEQYTSGFQVGNYYKTNTTLKRLNIAEGTIVRLIGEGLTVNLKYYKLPEDTSQQPCYDRIVSLADDEVTFITPNAKQLGYKGGDKFKVIKDSVFAKESIVELVTDDNSFCPYFVLVTGDPGDPISGVEEFAFLEKINDGQADSFADEVDGNNLLTNKFTAGESNMYGAKSLQDVADLLDWESEVIVRIVTKDVFEVVLDDRVKQFDDIDELYHCVKALVEFFRD